MNLLSMIAWIPVFKKEFLSGNYRVWIHSKTLTWDDKNIQLTLLMVWLLLAIRLLKIPIPPSSNQHDSASMYSINKTIVQKLTLWIIFQYVFGLRVFPFSCRTEAKIICFFQLTDISQHGSGRPLLNMGEKDFVKHEQLRWITT